MNYIIVNNSTLEEFTGRAKYWLTNGLLFTIDYVEHVEDPEIVVPGGWGCFRFSSPLPSSVLFDMPDVEYRYSEEQNAWLANGQLTPYSHIAEGLHTYFVSREGSS